MTRALRAEWTKLRTTRSTPWLAATAVVLTLALSTAVTAAAAPDTTSCAGGCDATRLSLSGVYLGQVPVVVLAALAVTGEYHTGLIANTLTADPRRLRVLAAKVAVVVTVVLGTGLLAVAGSLAVGRVLLPGNGFNATQGYPPLSPFDSATLRAATGTVLYLGLVALLSLGIGTAARSTTTAITTVLALLYLFPILAQFVPDQHWHARIERYAPMPAGLAVQATYNLDGLPIGPWAGLGVLTIYAGAATLLAAAVFTFRDP